MVQESPRARIVFLSSLIPGPAAEEPATTLWLNDRNVAALARDGVATQLSLFDDPHVLVLDLAGVSLSPSAIQEVVLPLAQRIRGGEYGAVVLAISATDQGVTDFVRYMADAHQLPLYLSDSPFELRDGIPVGGLTKTESRTLDAVVMLGGQVTASQLAASEGIGPSAATNRLVNLDRDGYLFRLSRSRREGDLYMEPRSATAAAVNIERTSETSDSGTGIRGAVRSGTSANWVTQT